MNRLVHMTFVQSVFGKTIFLSLDFPTTTGANHVSLIVAQRNCARYGVCESRFRSQVRPPKDSDVRDREPYRHLKTDR